MRNTLAECRCCWCPRRRRDRGFGPLHAWGTDGGRTAARALPLPIGFLTASLASPGPRGAGQGGVRQLITTRLNRETISGSREQPS